MLHSANGEAVLLKARSSSHGVDVDFNSFVLVCMFQAEIEETDNGPLDRTGLLDKGGKIYRAR